MNKFIPGQRWISEAELQAGLGTVLASDRTRVTVLFLATGETRVYAVESAPLTRVSFARGDEVRSHEGWALKIDDVQENKGLLTYVGTRDDGTPAALAEGQLDNFIQLNRPTDRLFTGQIDADKWFELRYQTLHHLNRLAHSDLYGLTGGRTSLIPHQLYIAHEVANRYAPRVLLADEVGLGKTIEAGLILHHQLVTHRARRVLIVVPESLVHQWLVEMLRRFNLHFSIFDEERCQAVIESSGQENPFQAEQLVLCSLAFLVGHPDRFAQAAACDWDLLVVDEAHHLQWSAQHASIEYQYVEQLSRKTKGVLLLTATPEQLGKASHFARLRLLDADRFPDLESFLAEEALYEPVALAVEKLLTDEPLDEHAYFTLLGTLKEGDNQALLDTVQRTDSSEEARVAARRELVDHLLDRHGTGRVLFRNTRAAIKGFPERKLRGYPLPLPEAYADCLADFQTTGVTDTRLLLCPELLYQARCGGQSAVWTKYDPRVEWLGALLKDVRPQKVLVIAASADTAMDIAEALRVKSGVHAAVFHEGMSIVERDRAAAFFALQDYGSQVLICSEIGSEGRNFQFAHHLVLFDLPLNPDLLEQRIGRLDRIGQTSTIQIHVPFLESSPQEIMYRWYHEGLSAFEHTCPAGHNVFVQVEPALIEALHQIDAGLEDLPALVDTTRRLYQEMSDALQRGRDRLLEYNSCRPNIADNLRDRAAALDAESDVMNYLEHVFDCYGIDMEDHSEDSFIVRPADHMQSSYFPALPQDGMTITGSRQTALANEDMQFVTWEHPLVTGAMDMVTTNELGNTALTAVKLKGVKPATLLLECLYTLESAGGEALQSTRYLPPTTIRVVVDALGKDHSQALTHETINRAREGVDSGTSRKIVRKFESTLRAMVAAAETIARHQAPSIVAQAHGQAKQMLEREIHRLNALQRINPNIRPEEIAYFETQARALTAALDSARARLDALRVLVAT